MPLKTVIFLLVSLLIYEGISDRIEILKDNGHRLKEAFSWSRISYSIPKDNFAKILIPNEIRNKFKVIISENNETLKFNYKNNVPMGANRWKNKLFITVPRRRDGVLSTLNYIPMHAIGKYNVPLIPYPDFESNRYVEPAEANVHRFVSVYRVGVDVCDRLWFTDTGRIQTPGNDRRLQPQALYVIDLHKDKIIRKYQFKDTDINDDMNGFFGVTIDTTIINCNDAYAYIPDSLGGGIVVYSFKLNDSWRFEHESFAPEPNQNGFLVGGVPALFKDGIFSITLSEIKQDGFRDAYYHPMIGISLYKVSTKVLKDKTLAGEVNNHLEFKLVGRRLMNSQTTNSAVHQASGLMFFALVAQNAVGCWNTHYPFKATDFDVVYKDDVAMIYPSDLKIYKDDLIVISSKFPVFIYGELNYEETNFRVFMASVYDAAWGTKCVGYRQPV